MNRIDFRCGAVRHDVETDPVTGQDVFVSHEARFITEDKHPSCTDMNTGDCPIYEQVV
jgi:hypothetical protein